ncbi:glycerol-3-phosphate 1-O-acyltransferase PlsY [Thiopseudomonas alkaliphila]|uniref:glycerol-3-phosphate 1-O-acyltransferase PlsY n=1 Tax=Thiopseudomonas alkaliphila TaxID=1697053 RepID=UPI00257830A0|nr:glycerol-3-phosphate 1-O-acyltransferase PlsY [Thiopseudomonas alkaliphila]MDM1715952.1 glycerol-3-phosphate 1-O-acyltransferase PlsY [Thiopseudomonas alkaliphila]
MFWLLIVFAYLFGSVSFAILLSQHYGGFDPRLKGSGNPGATNVFRVSGKRIAILTLLGDISKGLLPVFLAYLSGYSTQAQAWVGLAAVVGHLYPIFFNFRGGKGISTGAGMLLGLHPPAALIAILAWILTFHLTRTSSLASMSTLPLSLPFLAWRQPEALVPVTLLSLLIVWRHRQNLKDLLHGAERRF